MFWISKAAQLLSNNDIKIISIIPVVGKLENDIRLDE